MTKNAQIIYLMTDMGNLAREFNNFPSFQNRWLAKMVILSVSKNSEDLEIYEAMKNTHSEEFYQDARKN